MEHSPSKIIVMFQSLMLFSNKTGMWLSNSSQKSEQKGKIMNQFLQSDLLIPQTGNPEKVTYGSFYEVTTWRTWIIHHQTICLTNDIWPTWHHSWKCFPANPKVLLDLDILKKGGESRPGILCRFLLKHLRVPQVFQNSPVIPETRFVSEQPIVAFLHILLCGSPV